MPTETPDFASGMVQQWSSNQAKAVFSTYQTDWIFPVGSRGNGLLWLLDPNIPRADLDACAIDHEDWMYQYMQVGPGAVVLDLASFVGTHAIWMAKRGAQVIAVEPMPRIRDSFEKNIILNGVTCMRFVIPMAFGSHSGTARMKFAAYGSTVTSDGDTSVGMTTIDKELSDLGRLDLIKLDVEGFECEVIDGGRETIGRLKPRIIIEVHSHMAGREANGTILANQLRELGYRFKKIWSNTDAYYYSEAVSAP